MSRKALFSGEGYLGTTTKISPFDGFEGGLNFRTLQPSGLLFYHSEGVKLTYVLIYIESHIINKINFRFQWLGGKV